MAELNQDRTLATTQTLGKAKSVTVDAKTERQHFKDLETIRKNAASFIESEHLFQTATNHPDKAHAIAVMVSSKSFQAFDKTIQEIVFRTALSLGQNWTKESVVNLKNLVTSGSFASSPPEKQAGMLNEFTNSALR